MENILQFLMYLERFVFLYSVVLTLFGETVVESKTREILKSFEIDENLLQRRCELICYRKTIDKCSVQNCVDDIRKLTKPGGCPHSTNSFFEETCFQDCQSLDYKCPSTEKCCKQPCGWSCQEPIGLLDDTTVPPIPFNVTITERRKKGRMCGISWQMPLNHTFKHPIHFVVEARSHIGSIFSHHKLGDWHWYDFHKIAEVKSHGMQTKTTLANLKLKTGRWYKFRVAAVNVFGYRGYSKESKEFRLSDENNISAPKPPKSPKSFSVVPIEVLANNTLHAKATWCAPKSDLPIEKYRISWALYLKAENDSLLLNDAYVKEPVHQYDFWNLATNSLYYIQVQAISVIGKRRLKSSKESLMLNTTLSPNTLLSEDWQRVLLINTTEYETSTKIGLRSSFRSRQSDIAVKFIANKKFGMLVRVLWSELYKGSLLELCTGTSDCETKEYGAVRPKKNHIDFNKLQFDTQYTVRLIDPDSTEDNESVLTFKVFTTPTCESWINKFPNLDISC